MNISLQSISRFSQNLIFLIIQIPLLPISIIGAIVTGIGSVFSGIGIRKNSLSKKLSVSSTAGKVMLFKWLMHHFKSREDRKTVDFLKAIPTESHYGLLCFMSAGLIANRICGYKPSLSIAPKPKQATVFNYTNSRIVYFDKVMEKSVDSVEQVVVMGAGFDLRVLKYTNGKKIKVFELDIENIQNLKLEVLKNAKINYDWITYIPINFNKESWSEKLEAVGFNPDKKTFYLWEGVTVYLEEKIVRQTLKTISKISAKGSFIAFEFYSKTFITGEESFFLRMGSKSVRKSGEPWIFGIDTSNGTEEKVRKFLQDCNLKLNNCKILGKDSIKMKPLGGLVVASVE